MDEIWVPTRLKVHFFYFLFCRRLPDGWPARLNVMDEIWVPTQFHRNIFEANHVPSHKLQVILFFIIYLTQNPNPQNI